MTTPPDPRSPQPPQGQPPQPAGVYQTPGGAATAPTPQKVSFLKAITPEPSKAPPLEWVAMLVGLILAVSALLPWVNAGDSGYSGLDTAQSSGNGWLILGAGLAAVVLGFFGLSRDSISLAAGQAVLGLITLIFAILDLSPGDGNSPGFGVYLALAASVILILLSIYNAIDARRKGATY